MRAVVVMATAVVLGSALGLASAAPPPAKPDPVKDLRAVTVALVKQDGEPFCTGVWVAKRLIATARHCVKEQAVIDYALEDRKARSALVIASDDRHDVALLYSITEQAHPVATIGRAQQGERVRMMGHPIGLWYSYSSGDVAAVRAIDFGQGLTTWVQSTVPTTAGNSGSGLFNDAGEMVGVCSGSMRGQNLNLFSDAAYVSEMVKAWEILQ